VPAICPFSTAILGRATEEQIADHAVRELGPALQGNSHRLVHIGLFEGDLHPVQKEVNDLEGHG
jgi:hypothetical protein